MVVQRDEWVRLRSASRSFVLKYLYMCCTREETVDVLVAVPAMLLAVSSPSEADQAGAHTPSTSLDAVDDPSCGFLSL